MNKLEIQHLLSHQKVNSISDIICFVIDQVNKTLSHEPLQQICLRINQLQKAKGLDVVMIEEVKTICEAMIDQREQCIRNDFDKTLNDHWQHIERALNNNNQNSKSNRQSLAQIDILNFLNTNSFNTNVYQQDFKRVGYQDQNRRIRQSLKDFSKQITRDNLMSDCNRLNQNLQSEKKQINELKHSIMQINREISNKITLEQAHTIITQFESRMYHKIQNEKLQLQKLEFSIKKQLQEEILKVRKQSFIDFDFENLRKQLSSLKRLCQKLEKKVEKFRDQTKSVGKAFKSIQNSWKLTENQVYQHKNMFEEYRKLNSLKNEDLSIILDEINKKLADLDKIDQIELQMKSFSSQFAKAHWLSQCKTKNQSIVWEKELINTNSDLFKFEPQKSQILIQEPGYYLVEFWFFQNKLSPLSGSLYLQSLGSESNRKQIKAAGAQSLKFMAEVQDKSKLWLKLFGSQSNPGFGGRGILKISKY